MLDWKASAEDIKIRRDICDKCEHKTALQICGVCFCLLPFKTTVKVSECPIGKWKPIVT